mmetsp:Transcript_22723/g.29423  ORF Transcript_22723/g.29423 Transcript_22723/m.29423 type:complete len:416 (+) Transcript_22723:263-1510(+)|eukprot:CAMPEP_0197288390 /NCGR_PEP_ID=MMETSP0890-20130614/5452_1 /TAXON_ID=44058 ORGANISM="Aureoumbra lagunensis, Strain CCMP1510" /NCGR_SAMPLE_ID=MMETSP0890 /ASSEMBLY_ACC=CAM_ASM_000533 /LENGTH=415 /DNA_ID=CAMNT_0042759075 /DNA_START=159 /DNA_END=1406 /DNA_ORIENTATION=+
MGISEEHLKAIAERQERVKQLYEEGLSASAIATRLQESIYKIRRDLQSMDLPLWSDITDDELDAVVKFHLYRGHGALGRRLLEARLIVGVAELGIPALRIQRFRIRESLVRLNSLRAPPRKLRRRAWYDGRGALHSVHLDQNEKINLAKAGIKFFAAIDGHSRYPIYWEAVTNLRAVTHARFFQRMVRNMMRVPAHIVVDRGPWQVLDMIMQYYWGDNATSRVYMAEGDYINVRRFQQTTSVRSTPVERQWGDLNDVTFKYRAEFDRLIAMGYLNASAGAYDATDMFCLNAAFRDDILFDVRLHYDAMALRRKESRSRNPNLPKTFRVLDFFLSSEDHSRPVTEAEVAFIDDIVDQYFQVGAYGTEQLSPWEIDPLQDPVLRQQRDVLVAAADPQTAADRYIAMRIATRSLYPST